MIISESMKERYCTKLTNENATIYSDVIAANGGNGEHLGPHDLLCSGIASCLNITTRMILERMEITYNNVIVKVDIDNRDETKTKFVYDVSIDGPIDDEIKEIVMDKLTRSPIRKTLSKEIEFEAL